jgi:hypothetical protein
MAEEKENQGDNDELIASSDGPRKVASDSASAPSKASKLERPGEASGSGSSKPATDLESAWIAAGDEQTKQAEAEAKRIETEQEELDRELMDIPVTRRRRHPIIGIIVIALSAYLMIFSWQGMQYFLQSNQPQDLGDVSELSVEKLKKQPLNRYVMVRGAPDRKHALVLKGKVSGYESFFRLRLANNRVFVQRHRSERQGSRVLSSVHTGRLVSFGSLPYRESIRKYYAKNTSIEHDLTFKALASVNAGQTVKDTQGARVTLKNDMLFWINVSYPDEWLIQFSKMAYKTREDAKAHLDKLSLPFAVDKEASPSFWRFVVIAGEKQAKQLMALFRDPKLNIGVLRRQVAYTARFSELAFEKDTLVIKSRDETFPLRYSLDKAQTEGGKASLVSHKSFPVRIPKAAVRYMSTASKLEIADDALVVKVGEVPGDKWLYVLLYVVLGLFFVFNVIALIKRFTGR